jgi:hypothetical protein
MVGIVLGKLISSYRRIYDLTLGDVSKRIGVPVTPLHRFERGKPISDFYFARIIRWAVLNPDAKAPRPTNGQHNRKLAKKRHERHLQEKSEPVAAG